MNDIFTYEKRKDRIGSRIKMLRKNAGFTQEQLASRLDYLERKEKMTGQNTISSWESGKTLPPLSRLIALSVVFNCDISFLLCDYDEQKKDVEDISNITGLSESAVNYIMQLQKEAGGGKNIKALNYLLTCDNMDGGLSGLANYFERGDTPQNLGHIKGKKQEEMYKTGEYSTNLLLANQIASKRKENHLNEYELSTQFSYVIQEIRRKTAENIKGGGTQWLTSKNAGTKKEN